MAVAAGRYPTGSEARQAVLCSAANRGWTLADVTTRIDDGRWAGLRQLYTRYRTGRQRALARDWNKALSRAVRKSVGPVSTSDTSPNTHRGTRGTTERDQISKEWISVFLDAATNASPRWGRNAGRNRALLQSLAYAASHTGSRVIDWGVRSYGLGAGLGRSTAADVLRALAGEDDPFLTRVAGGVYDQADTYRLRLPDTVSLRRRGAGLKPRPVPDVLIDRPKSGLGVYQALSTRPRTLDELAERSQHSRATVYRRLDDLAELGLAARTKDGRWVRGQLGLAAAAWRTGGYQLHRARVRRYRRERQAWRARLDAWYRPAALIPAPRPPSDIPASPPPAAHAPRPADEADPHWHLAEPPDDDPWAGPSPETPAEPLDMVLQLLEEVLGAVPIDEHGWRPHRRSRPRPAKPAGTITRRGAPASRPD